MPPGDVGPESDGGDGPMDGGAGDAGPSPGPLGVSIFRRLSGLWSGPATQTRLGNFPLMNVDLRMVEGQVLFGRVDLDEQNALRFAFSLETHDGRDQVVYRNGGYFLGLLRDDRTILDAFDPAAERYHFCHLTRGCDYTDVTFDFDGPEQLHFRVLVRGQVHVDWQARRLHAHALGEGFEDTLVSQGNGDAPIPSLPGLAVTSRFNPPTGPGASAWLLLALEGCSLTGCGPARQLRSALAAGASSTEFHLDEVHAGAYEVQVVLDRNGDLATTFAPNSGDGLSLPRAIQVASTGTTSVDAPIAFTLP